MLDQHPEHPWSVCIHHILMMMMMMTAMMTMMRIMRICWMHTGSRSQSSSDVDSDDDDDRTGQPPEGTKEARPTLDTSSVTVAKLHQQPAYPHPSGYDPNRCGMSRYQCKCYL